MKTHLRVVGSGNPAPVSLPQYSYEDWVEDLRGIIWNAYVKGRMTLEEMAVQADLSAATVERFAWGDTKRPHARTLFQLAAAAEYRIPFLPAAAPRQPDEPDLGAFRQFIRKRP